MKKFTTAILTMLLTWSLAAQNFEGKIIYQYTYRSKTAALTNEQLGSMMGTQHEYWIKEGNYKTETNGAFLQWQLYSRGENKLYTKMANSETLLFNEGSENKDEVLSFQHHKGVIEILGYKCDELILTCKSGVQKYYFSPRYGIDPAFFTNHKYGNWYDYLSKAKAVPLKMVVENQQFTVESVAVDILPMQLMGADFALPANAKTAKTPY